MKLKGKKVVILVEDMYNEFELWYPYYRLIEEGADVTIVGPGRSVAYLSKFGIPAISQKAASEISADDFDGIIVPGGYAPDKMRIHPAMVKLVRDAFDQKKVVASICHGGWMLVSAGILKGLKVTSYVAIKDDMVNAGAIWEDSELTQDANVITSRKPDDLPAFCRAIIAAMTAS